MKKLIIIFTFLTSGLFGQDNPMFNSVGYFLRNKIKTVHWHISKNYCSPGWDYLKFTFDNKTNTLKCDSIHYDDPNSSMAKAKTSYGTKDFVLKDTVYNRPGFAYSTTIKYEFGSSGRLTKMLNITEYYPDRQVDGLSASDRKYTTTTEYFYTDDTSKKITKETTESPYYHEERIFIYNKNRLTKRISTKTEKGDKTISTDTFLYEYYADGKLRKETRQLISSRYKEPMCEGSIEYKYDVD